WLAEMVYRHPRFFYYPHYLLVALAIWFTVEKLGFSASRNDLVGSDKKYHQIYLQFKKEFSGQDDIVAVVESEDKEKNRQFVERLGARVEAETNLFTEVLYKGDLKMLGKKALLFLEEGDLIELQKTLKDYKPFVAQFTQATNLNSLFRLVNAQFRSAAVQTNAQTDSMIGALPALKRIIDQASDSLVRMGAPPSPGVTALFDPTQSAEERQYITFGEGRIYLLNTKARREDLNAAAVERLRQLVAEVQREVPGLNVGVTGEPVLEVDEMAQSQKDSTVASILSLAGCAAIFIAAYRETGRPLKATFALVIGLGYTMGYTTLSVGHLNILTITFLPILIGLAIDFGVHLITRYEEELRHGRGQKEAMSKAMVFTGLGIFTGCFTTAGAFFAMGLTDFKGIQEMGIITGGGLLICLIPMMTMLPVMLMKGRQNRMDQEHPPAFDRRERLEQLWLKRPVVVSVMTLASCLFCLVAARHVRFDYNLLNMQSHGLPAVVFEHKLIEAANKSVLYAAVVSDSVEEALALEARITNLTSVASVDSMSHFLTGDQTRKLAIIGEIKHELASLRFPPPDPDPVDVSELSRTLWALQGYLGLGIQMLENENQPALRQSLHGLRDSIVEFRHRMLNMNQTLAASKLAAYQQAFLRDLRETFAALRNQDNSSPLRVPDLPEQLRNRFVGQTGKYLLQVYPKKDVWERENQEEFVRELRTVAPNVTGTPVQLYEYTTLLKESYQTAAWYALAAIVLLVFIHFRSVVSVILALLPVGIGFLWTLGFMALLKVPFNPANIMTLPLVIGIGVTNGIHILNRFAEEQNPSILAKSTGKAVLVSALTTIAGFGSLIPAKHQGIASLGILMSVGVGACMLAAIIFLPALLTLLIRFGWVMKKTQ
ncbi:MAG TPA: MMPL family transporter, partial [Methylomirabilota bacterium]|nr:MMPL family transporter [Methylomirabilota bacterium]